MRLNTVVPSHLTTRLSNGKYHADNFESPSSEQGFLDITQCSDNRFNNNLNRVLNKPLSQHTLLDCVSQHLSPLELLNK